MSMPFAYVAPDQIERDKANFARERIGRGRPAIALEYAEGVAFVAENPNATLYKISEIYDRIAFAGVGKYNEYESLRVAGIQYAETTGFNYSRDDVSARAIANNYSQILGRIFTESMKPYEVEVLIGEVAADGGHSQLFRVTFNGIMSDEHGHAAIGGNAEELRTYLKERHTPTASLDEAVRLAVDALGSVAESRELNPQTIEAAVLDRTLGRRKFKRLDDDRIASALQR